MSPSELNQRLCAKPQDAVRYLYGDSGKFAANRFTIGNAQGESGDSLVVYLANGRFKDMATGDHGDLLELFCLKLGSKAIGINAAYSFLNITKPMSKPTKIVPWKKPVVDWEELKENPKVLDYLTTVRKLSKEVLEETKVRAKDDKYFTFLTFTHDDKPKICGANNIGIKKIVKAGKSKKDIHQSENPLATLFAHPVCDTSKRFIIVTEGQIDCLSFWSQGIKNVVSVPFGASSDGWIENSWDWLQQFKEIYLCFDNDDAGQKAAEKAAGRLGYEKCRNMQVPAHFNDANDAHVDGFQLTETVDAAVEFKPDKLVTSFELAVRALEIAKQGRRELVGDPVYGWGEQDEDLTVNFRLRPREWTIWTGYPGHGKSNALYQLVAYLVFKLHKKVFIASLEEDSPVIMNLIAIHAIAHQYSEKKNIHDAFVEIYRSMEGRIFFYDHRGRADMQEMLKTLEFTVRKHGVEHVIIDSVAKTNLNIEDNAEANEFVNHISTSVDETGAHYHIVAHSRKGDDKSYDGIPGLSEVKGAAAFGIECFNCITVWRNKAKGFMMERALKNEGMGGFKTRSGTPGEKVHTVASVRNMEDSLFIVNKQKVGGQTGQFRLYYDKENYRLHRSPDYENEPYATDIHNHYIINSGRKMKALAGDEEY